MVEKDKYLVVVSVRQGKNFPKRSKHALVVEARFEGELLSTDPVEHSEYPDFTQELAWELDKKALHQHRMQRTSVKVQVFSQDVVSSVREAIGYVILDLRSAQNQAVLKSHPLLHTKYQRNRPEIELGLYIDEGKTENPGGKSGKEVTSQGGISKPLTAETVDPRILKPVFDDSCGFYQIGPIEVSAEKFVLTISINSAANLVQLVPINITLPATGYFFYYSLLGNDIVTETFSDLLNPRFPVERVSTRLSGQLELIRQFFASQPGLEVHLCCGDQSLGSCTVPLGGLVKKGSSEIYMKPLLITGSFQLVPAKSSKLVLPKVLPEDQRPVIGLSVALQLETATAAAAPSSSPLKDAPRPRPAAQVLSRVPNETADAVKPSPRDDHSGSYVESRSRSEERSGGTEDNNRGQRTEASSRGASATDGVRSAMSDVVQTENGRVSPGLDSHATAGDDLSSDTPRHVTVPAVPHHFRVSIDLRSVSDLAVSHPAWIFLKYAYRFFGSSSPVLTEPPVEARRGTEVNFPKSFCAFDFATTIHQLEDTFSRIPLDVEVWQRDRQMSQNVCLGVAQVMLSTVFKAPKLKTVHSSGTVGWKQNLVERFTIHSRDAERRKLGDLQVSLTLENWGPIVQQTIIIDDQPRSEEVHRDIDRAPRQPSVRETQEYQVALELELWKEERQKQFDEELQAKERQYLKELGDEYKRRDKEQQLLVAKKRTELDKLMEELRKTLTDLEKREKKLAVDEQKVLNDRTTLEREHRRKMTELEDASRRFKDDCEHQVVLERKKIQDLEESVSKMKQRLAEEESKCQRICRDFEAYKSKASSQPEVRLQAELMQAKMEKVELEKQLEKLQLSKVQYKQQFVKACRELGKRDKKFLKESRVKERQRLREIEHLKLHYQMKIDRETESKELGQIKKEKLELERSSGIAPQNYGSFIREAPNAVGAEPTEEDEHVVRLIAERDLLLRTGTYSAGDDIIANLEREIHEITRRSSEKTSHLSNGNVRVVY